MTLTWRRAARNVNVVMVAKAKSSTLEQRVEAFRALVREAIEQADSQGRVLKAYDGKVSLTWPSQVEAGRRGRRYVLSLSCSALGGTGHFSWIGSSWRTVFSHAAEDVAQWIDQAQQGDPK
jgi:hypothetical protein